MKSLVTIIMLLATPLAQAANVYRNDTEAAYRISCERTILRIFTKYGAGKAVPQEQEVMAVKSCQESIDQINKDDGWKRVESPMGSACADVVDKMAKLAPHRYPKTGLLYMEFCHNITAKDL